MEETWLSILPCHAIFDTALPALVDLCSPKTKPETVVVTDSRIIQYHLLTCYYQILQIIGLSILTLVECLRLYLGYIGNLYEKVPELAAFLLLTFMIQIPLILFLLTDEEVLILPLEYAVHAIYTVFLSMELLVSFFVLKVMTRTLATEFFLHHSDDTEKDLPGRNLCQGM
ncbi:transmembrane 17A-like [Pelobates cultripes]|uniref:Transmembrane 17A-like n=1 Tax=Pelobates cultripes TaxID=61616 RepID=A0AAD1VZH9_PELCU|nr:transmembrane 17A-like [Pelobates cultripes]